jgi:hypothetical protein
MTNFPINSTVYVSAEKGRVLAVEAGKRGKTLVTVEFANGRIAKFDSRSVSVPIEFEPPCTAEEFFAPLPSSAQALRNKINRS